MVIPGHDVHEEDVLGFGVESRDLYLVTGKHPPVGQSEEKSIDVNSKNTFNKVYFYEYNSRHKHAARRSHYRLQVLDCADMRHSFVKKNTFNYP